MKTLRHALLPLLLILLAACSGQDEAASASPATTAPAPMEQAAPAADTAPAGSADDAAGAAAPAASAPEGPPPVAGVNYVEIEDAQPLLPLEGKVEVVEVFGYTCPACASFEPLISSWKQRQPDDVRVTLLAAPFGGFWMPYAKAYYAAEALGIAEATHRPMFDAIHRQRELPVQGASTDAIAAFYASHGADARQFAQTMESFAVSGQLRRARQFIERAGVDSTPTMVVNGKYRVIAGQDFQDVLRTVDHLVARERAAEAPVGQ